MGAPRLTTYGRCYILDASAGTVREAGCSDMTSRGSRSTSRRGQDGSNHAYHHRLEVPRSNILFGFVISTHQVSKRTTLKFTSSSRQRSRILQSYDLASAPRAGMMSCLVPPLVRWRDPAVWGTIPTSRSLRLLVQIER
jgi:hypothetical protein